MPGDELSQCQFFYHYEMQYAGKTKQKSFSKTWLNEKLLGVKLSQLHFFMLITRTVEENLGDKKFWGRTVTGFGV